MLARIVQVQDSNKVTTQMEPGLRLEKYEGKPHNVSDEWSYRSVIGSVMFMANQLRPDVSFAVHHLAKFTSYPGPEHHRALVRVVKYLYHTRNKKLTLGSRTRIKQSRQVSS